MTPWLTATATKGSTPGEDATARGTCKVGEDCSGVKVLKQHTGLATRLYTVNFSVLEFYYVIHFIIFGSEKILARCCVAGFATLYRGCEAVWRLRERDKGYPDSGDAPQPPRRRAYLLTSLLRAPRSPSCLAGPEPRRLANSAA